MATIRKTQRYGWKPDVPDVRDRYLHLPFYQRIALPKVVDLRPKMPPVYDQGDLGSCTGNAIAGAIQYQRAVDYLPDFVPSRLFIYYNERVIENTVNEDAGAQIRDGIKSVVSLGAARETEWPYDISKFRDKPPDTVYAHAKQSLVTKYLRVPQTERYLKGTLAQGYAVVFGFTVYESFESNAVARTGLVPMPKPEEVVVGGHAVLLCGYNDSNRVWVVRNSWGKDWGLNGYCYFPYEYLLNADLADDFWAIQAIEPE